MCCFLVFQVRTVPFTREYLSVLGNGLWNVSWKHINIAVLETEMCVYFLGQISRGKQGVKRVVQTLCYVNVFSG